MKFFSKIKKAAEKTATRKPNRFWYSIVVGTLAGIIGGIGTIVSPMTGQSTIMHIATAILIAVGMFVTVAILFWSNTMGLDRWLKKQESKS